MKALIHPALTALAKLIKDNDLAAARYVLDYAGFKAKDHVEMTGDQVIQIVLDDRGPLVPHHVLDVPGHTNGAASAADPSP